MRIAALSDLHLVSEVEPESYWHNRLEFESADERLQIALENVLRLGADLLVFTGDLAHHGDQTTLSRLMRRLAVTKVPRNRPAREPRTRS